MANTDPRKDWQSLVTDPQVKAILAHQPRIALVAKDLGVSRGYAYMLCSPEPQYERKRFTEDNLQLLRSKGYPIPA